jgi:hypothetical protein
MPPLIPVLSILNLNPDYMSSTYCTGIRIIIQTGSRGVLDLYAVPAQLKLIVLFYFINNFPAGKPFTTEVFNNVCIMASFWFEPIFSLSEGGSG